MSLPPHWRGDGYASELRACVEMLNYMMSTTLVAQKSAHDISMATIIPTCTEGNGTTLLVLRSSGSVFHTLHTMQYDDNSCDRRDWRNAKSRHVQTYELVLYCKTASQDEEAQRKGSDTHIAIHTVLSLRSLPNDHSISEVIAPHVHQSP